MKKRTQTITAHRGCTEFGDFENTLKAFKKAIELKCDGIELDIRRSLDNKLFVHHNDHIGGLKLANLTFDEILLESMKHNYTVSLFIDVLSLCQKKIFLDIELKESGYEEEVIKLIKQFLDYDDFYLRSFIDKSLRRIKKLDKNIKTGLLLGVGDPRFGFITRISEIFPLFRVLISKCDFVSPYYRLLILGYTKRMHLLGKPVIVWTVNDAKLIDKLLFVDQVDGIITDKPHMAKIIAQKNKVK
jgi:glycerophosphoryl diester phosphodiesterase